MTIFVRGVRHVYCAKFMFTIAQNAIRDFKIQRRDGDKNVA